MFDSDDTIQDIIPLIIAAGTYELFYTASTFIENDELLSACYLSCWLFSGKYNYDPTFQTFYLWYLNNWRTIGPKPKLEKRPKMKLSKRDTDEE